MNPVRSSAGALSPGDVVDRYTVEAMLGVGGMATVYLVRHNALGSLHALKVLHLVAPTVRDRLVQEGRVQASLRHPNVVAVTDIVDVHGSPGLVMEYVSGPTLDAWLGEHRPTFEQADALFRGILAGVERAHREGLVHRDLKPANVLLDTSSGGLVPKVADFGLAKVLAEAEPEPSRTRTGTTMGTPAYMAPEQVRDAKSVDQRADIFALGCILYELYTGESPFARPDLLATFAALSAGSYAPPESLAPDLPARVRAAIRGALAREREERIESCEALLGVLDGRIAAQRTANARAGWLLAGLALVGAVGAVVSLGGAYVSWRGAAVEEPPPSLPAVVTPAVAPIAAVAPDPAAEPEPAPAPQVAPDEPQPDPVQAAPAPAARIGRVDVSGDATEVWLEQDGVRYEVGAVPPGTYTLKASFGGPPVSKDFVVRAGAATQVSCDAAFQMCRVAR